MTDRDTYYSMSKWQWFVEGFRNVGYIVSCYKDLQSSSEHYSFNRDDFFEALSWGWMTTYVFPYDDPYNPYLSPERKLRLGRW